MSVDRQTVQKSSASRSLMPQRVLMKVHTAFYRLSGGKIGGSAGSRAFLLLITIGRKSGRERVTPIFYMPDGERFILIASNWGASVHPQWWLNLQTHPQAKVRIGRKLISVTARQAEGDEYTQLWSSITAKYENFAEYQRKTTRKIPVVILTPAQ